MPGIKNWPLVTAAVIAVSCMGLFLFFLKWDGVFLSVKVTDLAGLLAPLAFAAAVVERAVEIIISPWRDAGASKLENVITAINARPNDPGAASQNALDLKAAKDALDAYRGETQKWAFVTSITLSFFVAMAGIRALGPFLDSAKFHDVKITSDAHRLFFLCVDVALSAALLAGGADGIHSVVNAITSFFDATADKTKP
jgi:hypothetical protein